MQANGIAVAGDAGALSERVKAVAYGLGFDLAGIAELGVPETRAEFDAWIAAGMHAEMAYLDGPGAELRRDARLPHAGATHAIVLAMNYGGTLPSGPIARYARGDDYHDVLRERLRALHRWLETETGQPINARPYVDSGPVLERDLAQRAGLGWFGKNTMLINPRAGSFLFLCSLFVEYPLVPDVPFEADRCGTCTRCMDACPTDAITGPRVLDARRCISYLTIELKGAIPEEFREAIGGNLYGCDICQNVCPWNVSFASALTEPAFAARDGLDSRDARALARELLAMSQGEFSARFRGSAMKRAKRRGLARNAAVVLGNVGTTDDVPLLDAARAHDQPLVREHAAWALAQIRQRDCLRPT
ncbi:MAG TPA: tRNA epoxyqueuosine(34) reductase QueG [Gemmatimonas sp.]|nr:tRNA epoxyqueuosine(34) reductase QueG [Gemmatimonas sp.]